MGSHRQERPRVADLSKRCSVIVKAHGLQAGETLPSPPGVHRVVVEGADLPRPGVLCVREGPAFPDTEARRVMATEHLAAVRELAAGVVVERGRRRDPVCARLGEHLPGGSLRRRLRGGALGLGEAVTILLAVIDVLHEAHHAGFAGVEPRADRIRFRADGCPVVTELAMIGPLTVDRARHDTEAFLALVREVARSLSDGDAALLLRHVDAGLAGGAVALREALLDVAPPVAVRMRAPEGASEGTIDDLHPVRTSRVRLRRPAVVNGPAAPSPRQSSGRRDRWEVLLDGRPVREARGAVVALVRRRPKLILGGVLPLVAATVVFVALPPGADPPADARAASAPTAAPSPSTTPSSAPASAAADAECPALDVFDLTGSTPSDGSDLGCPTGAEDPVEAALEWLAAQGRTSDESAARAEVAQRWGEAVLVRVEPGPEGGPDSEPASLLLVRGEAGWRVRAVYS